MKFRVMICLAVLLLATLLLVACAGGGEKNAVTTPTVRYPSNTNDRPVTASGQLVTAATTTLATTVTTTKTATASTPATAVTTAISLLEVPAVTEGYVTKPITPEQLAQGSLVLVNSAHPLRDGDLPNRLLSLYENKTARYQLAGDSLKLEREAFLAFDRMLLQLQVDLQRTDVLVRTAYRTDEEQRLLYDAGLAQYGSEVLHYTMPAGCSDYQTGLSVYLQTISGDPYELSDNYSKSVLDWLTSYAALYGFVQRYPASEVESTGIYAGVDDYHYRYVGLPHAQVMNYCGLSLEEYIPYLQGFTYGQTHLQMSFLDGTSYEIYYVPYTDGMTSIPVPATGSYTVSGTNAGGFIVTVAR